MDAEVVTSLRGPPFLDDLRKGVFFLLLFFLSFFLSFFLPPSFIPGNGAGNGAPTRKRAALPQSLFLIDP